MAALILEVNGKTPKIDSSCFIAENATLTGDIIIGKNSSVWFQTVIRGDVNQIRIGKNSNIQDLSMVHGTNGKQDTIIGDHVTVGHKAIIHGCTIENNVLIGMGAIILDDAIIKSRSIIAAGAVVTSGTICESGFIYAGIPAKKIKPLDAESAKKYTLLNAEAYVKYSAWYK